MRNGFLSSMIAMMALAAMGIALSMAPVPLVGQDAPAPPITRLPNGTPDLNGYWGARGSLGNITGIVVEVDGRPVEGDARQIPYQPWAAEKARLNNYRLPVNTSFEEPELHCFMSGVPTFMWRQFGPMHWVHTPQYLVMMHEFMGAIRAIPLDGRPHIPEDIKLFMGDGVGRWEGDTLVVETTNNNDITWLDNDGNIHSDELVVVERFTPTSANTIDYEATLTDPKAYTAPWKIRGSMTRNTSGTFEIMEFACIEGNRDVEAYTEEVGGRARRAPSAAPPGSAAPPANPGGRGGGGANP